MMASNTMIRRFLRDDTGATAVEYGLLVGLIAVAIMGGLVAVATSINQTFTTVETEMS
ncbi:MULTISPECIES: Flp family type IVb pilin [unclassified Hyphomonas]|jgi:pilus assembly protein Flp/PilA|uniref:Flp pilus assembly protein, pilin Flp n=2 Tax=root TaxID=1 RepID=A0A160TXS5_9ZZZZ|nr:MULTISPECIES: Flp family type IVb pilin [unclassified Hyphomonas]MDF1807635.1 Flp family type IVb pilin [Hyphomonas sp.]|tara:strand:+ start:2521 stop:2694 length:174 start_codon:yes stop_codon:yes gene_type:complete